MKRTPGGREGKRKLSDRYSLAGEEQGAAARPEPPARGSGERLRPGQLDGLVLGFLREHAADGPLSPSAVGKGLARSSGATANSLKRLAEAGQVREVSERPRRYEPPRRADRDVLALDRYRRGDAGAPQIDADPPLDSPPTSCGGCLSAARRR